MTHERDIERLLDTWFSDGPTEVPDRVINTVADRIASQPQRPAWRLNWRHVPMNAYLKPLALVAATILVAFLGFNLIGGFKTNSDVAAPAMTPSPTPAPSPSPIPTPSPSPTPEVFTCADGTTTACAGPLAAGTRSSVAFEPRLTFTVPDGWTNSFDISRTYRLDPSPHTFDLQVMSQMAIPEQNAECTAAAKPGAGNTVADWVDFITTHPGLVAGTPRPVSVGGFDGQRIQFHVADDWTGRCPKSIGPAVVLFTDSGTPPQRAAWFDDHRVTAWIIDVAGSTVIVHVDSGPSLNFNDADVKTVQPILDSMTFTPVK